MIPSKILPALAFLTVAGSSAFAQGISTCVPGSGGVIPCPCSNPGGPGAGCNNSLNTGGALLTATGPGSNSLSADSVQLNCVGIGNATPSCSGTNLSPTSYLYEGTAPITGGIVWNDGVICTGGPTYLLNIQAANGGVYHFPLPGTTGLSQAAISAGDLLVVGSVRWYYVAYRDTCPTFCNPGLRQKSNSYQITWGP
jgi:hypothetical protein